MGKENPIVRGAKAIVRSPVGRIGLTFLALNAGGIGCGAPKPLETLTPPRPTATAVGIGGPESPRTGNPEIDAIGQRLSNPETRGQVPEPEILRWNEAIEARAGALAATATAEAQKPTPAPEPTVEAKVAPVEIFPKEMDPYVEIVDYLNPKKVHVLIVGIKGLPEGMTEVPVSAPIGGGLRNATNDPNYAEVGDLNDITLTSFAFRGFKLDLDKKVQPGNRIGVLRDTGYREKLGDREYIATIDVYTKNSLTNQADWEKVNQIVKQYFPRAPIVSAEYNPAQTSNAPEIKQTVAFEDGKPAGLK